jgi:hypothetical protein
VEGCPDSAFPSTGRCPLDLGAAKVVLTIHGHGFDAANVTGVQFANFSPLPSLAPSSLAGGVPSHRQPPPVVCANFTISPEGTMIQCHQLQGPGFGQQGKVQLLLLQGEEGGGGGVEGNTSSSVSLRLRLIDSGATISWVSHLEHQCAYSSSSSDGTLVPGGVFCSGHGYCNPTDGRCLCYASSDLGFYSGDLCAVCDLRYNSTGCALLCPDSEFGAPCNNRGQCWNGVCTGCDGLFTGVECAVVCPGNSNEGGGGGRCSGHGHCSSTTGQCTCESSVAEGGFWAGTDCSYCQEAYSGGSCSLACPTATATSAPGGGGGSVLAVCGGSGVCLEGACICQLNHCGVACTTIDAVLCNTCPAAPGLWGASCTAVCPGSGGAHTPCAGHGICNAGTSGDGLCHCAAPARTHTHTNPLGCMFGVKDRNLV